MLCPEAGSHAQVHLTGLLLWDLMHPNDRDVQFKPVALIGESVVGLPESENRAHYRRSLAVFEWGTVQWGNKEEELPGYTQDEIMFLMDVINGTKIRPDNMIELPLPFKQPTPTFAFN